jgi:hypothetical protein
MLIVFCLIDKKIEGTLTASSLIKPNYYIKDILCWVLKQAMRMMQFHLNCLSRNLTM